jgi:hypothetical protein
LCDDLDRQRLLWLDDLAEDLIFGPKGLDATIDHHKQLIDTCQSAGAVRYKDDDSSARPHSHDGTCECQITLSVEV